MNKLILSIAILNLLLMSCGKKKTGELANIGENTIIDEPVSRTIEISGFRLSNNPIPLSEYEARARKYNKERTFNVIDNPEKVKEILDSILCWVKAEDHPNLGNFGVDGWAESERERVVLEKIITRRGEVINDEYLWEYEIVAYYPDEDLLLLEGEHSSSWAINLSSGEMIDIVGEPEMSVASPSGNLRMMGYYQGQYSVHTLQRKKGKSYENIACLLGCDDPLFQNLESVFNVFWVGDSAFYYHSEDDLDGNRQAFRFDITPL